METIVSVIALVLLVWAFAPAARQTAAAIDSFENPHKGETAEERRRSHRDGALLLFVVVAAFGLLFMLQVG